MRIILSLLAAVAGAPFASPATPRTKPHIILLMTDQQRADAIGCAGNKAVITPALDRLASDGYCFSNAYTAAPSSTPARAGLLTGMTPWHHGMLGYGQMAEHYRYEMPQMLVDEGYHAYGIGKMHWHPQAALHGFEMTLLDESGRKESPYFMSDYRKWFATQAAGLNPDSTGIGWNDHSARPYALPERLHPTAWTGDRAVELIKGYDSDKPLFLKVSFARPHSPYDAPQRLIDLYEGREIEPPVVGEWVEPLEVNPDPDSSPDAARGNFGPEYAVNSKRNYYASITFIDEQIARIVEALQAKGMYDDALICFVSDHGDMMGDHHLWRKTYPYEGSAAIPFIIKPPKSASTCIRAGETIEAPVELRDLLPTFLDVAGAAIPDSIDGMSVMPLLERADAPWRRYVGTEHSTCYFDDNYWCALTDGRVKYVWFVHSGKEQLFDLAADPDEIHDLSASVAHSQLLTQMRRAMVDYLSERGEEWVKDGCLVRRQTTMLYSPDFPKTNQ